MNNVKMNYKELINPLILLPIILLINYLIGFRELDLVIYSFIVFFLFSFINNITLVLRKKLRKNFYSFVYSELFFSLIFLIPLFYLINLKPILISFFILGLTDFLIQSYYNIMPRKNTKQIIKLWNNKLIKSERIWFHPISLQKYIFKDFAAEIFDSDKINPTRDYIYFDRFLSYKLRKHIRLSQLGGRNNIIFCLYANKHFDRKGLESISSEKDILIDKDLIKKLRKINTPIAKHILTAFKTRYNIIRIIFKKDFVLNNNKLVYDFLSKVYSKS